MTQKPSNTQKALKGISSQTLVTITLGLVEMISFSIMSRLLTKEDFGYYAAISAIVIVFASLSETGIGAAIVQCKNLTKKYIDNAFTISLIFGFLLTGLLFSLSGLLADGIADQSMKLPLMLMSITLLLHCLTSVFTSLMQRRLEFLRIGNIKLSSLIITTLIAIILAANGYGYYAIIVKAVLQSLIIFMLSWYFCKTSFGLHVDKRTSASIINYSGWLMASVVFRNIAQQLDRLMMPKLLSVIALGSYNRPKDFANQISKQINSIFDTALFPVLSSIQDNYGALKNSFNKSFYYLNIFSLLLFMGFFFNAELIIRIFFGNEWLELRYILQCFSISMIFNVDGRLADCYLRSMAFTKQQFLFRILETIIKIVSIVIGSKWDVLGIAIGVVASDAAIKLLKICYVSDKIRNGFFTVFMMLVKSCKFMCFVFPICLITYLLCPNSIVGEIIILFVFLISNGLVFLFVPSIVGQRYYEELYLKVKGKLVLFK